MKIQVSLAEPDDIDVVTLDVPLLIRILELCREDIKEDVQIHRLTSNLLDLKDTVPITMQHYDQIIEGVL